MNHRDAEKLLFLYTQASKHSAYQRLPTLLWDAMGKPSLNMKARHDLPRLASILNTLDFRGARVLDIGGNTGYFTFSALEHGATSVDYFEGNNAHSLFVQEAADLLNLSGQIQVRNEYFDFNHFSAGPLYHICLCLNVLHHLGDDFGDKRVSLEAAKRKMIEGMNNLASRTQYLVLQLGFNWKGNVDLPMFEHGSKTEMIDFIKKGTSVHWRLSEIKVAVDNNGISYQRAEGENLERSDVLGEFLNRPIFFLESLHNK